MPGNTVNYATCFCALTFFAERTSAACSPAPAAADQRNGSPPRAKIAPILSRPNNPIPNTAHVNSLRAAAVDGTLLTALPKMASNSVTRPGFAPRSGYGPFFVNRTFAAVPQ